MSEDAGRAIVRQPSAEIARALRRGRRYRIELDAEAFAELLEQHPRVALLDGPPTRLDPQPGVEISAWRPTADEFVLAPLPSKRHELEPPALHLRFEGEGQLHMQASLSLAAEFDAALRNWVDRIGLFAAGSMFFVGTYLGSIVLLAIMLNFLLPLLGAGQGSVFTIAALLAFVPAWMSSRFLKVFRFERASERAWRLALPPLHRIAGELITPHTLGAIEGAQALPYRARLRGRRRADRL